MKRKLLFSLFAFVPLAMSAQDITIKSSNINLHENISLLELDNISHGETLLGKPCIKVEMRNGAVHTATLDQISEVYTESREDALKRGHYANMKFVKDFTSLEELNKGDLIGVFNEDDYSLDEFTSTIYQGLEQYGVAAVTDVFSGAVKTNTTLLAATNLMSASNIRFHVVDIAYVGEDFDHSNIGLSARLIYPYSVGSKKLKLSKICIDNHVTVFTRGEEPSNMFSAFSFAGLCSRGYLIVQPDLLGFGVSDNRGQLYVDRDLNGSGVAYSLVAANQYAKIAATKSDGFTLSPSCTVTNMGASQGASTALGGTYFVENKLDPALVASMPKLTETRVCAGAYNMKYCMDSYCRADSMAYASTLPMYIAGAVIAHGDEIRDPEGRPYKVTEYFTPHFNTQIFTNYYGKTGNVWQLIDNKTRFEGMFNIYFAHDTNKRRASFSKIMNNDLIKKGDDGENVLDYDNPMMAVLKPIMEQNNLTNPNLWVPKSDLFLVHADNDEIIPYECSVMMNQNMSDTMLQNGNVCTFKTLNDVPEMSALFGQHMMTCFVWITSELMGLPVDSVYPLLKGMF